MHPHNRKAFDTSGGLPARRGNFRLGSILGVEIDVDASWLLLFLLVLWSLSSGVFPTRAPDFSSETHVAMGVLGTLLLFASLIAHELSHALVSRSKGIPIAGITLFAFGGMARTTREPDSPRDEVLIAGVGPLTSLALAALLLLGARLGAAMGMSSAVTEVLQYLAVINLALAVFNMAPAFPMDGGRVFRALAWGWTGDRIRATRMATTGGRWFGTFLMVMGAIQVLGGAALGGLWLVFIGWFVRTLAAAALQQNVLRDLMRGYMVADLMSPDPEVVPAWLRLDTLVRDRFLRLRYSGYPVVNEGELVGLMTLDDLKRVPSDRWSVEPVAQAMTPLSACAVLGPEDGVPELLTAIGAPGSQGRALVVDKERLVGIVSTSDVARWMHRVEWMNSLRGPRKDVRLESHRSA